MNVSGFFSLRCCTSTACIVIMKLKEKGGIFSMKRLLSVIMSMLLFCVLCFPASALINPSLTPVETPVPLTGSDDTTTELPDTPSTEPLPETPTETLVPTDGPDETTTPPTEAPQESTNPAVDEESCDHSWMYVEVNPSCTEYGGRGYVCIYCEALTELEAIDMIPHTYDNSCDADCNVCGAVQTVTHKFSTAWSRNSTQHWHACSVCGLKNDAASHYPGPAATEEKAQYCLTCGLMMMPKKAHAHQYSTIYTSDESAHWYTCEGCAERRDYELHGYDNPCDSDCNACGYTSVKQHDFDSWNSDGNTHWKICSLCGRSTEPEPHALDTERNETEVQTCSICDYAITAEPVHVHEGSGSWNGDDNNHWKLCECGETLEAEPHVWDEGREAGDGVLYICRVCGAEKREVIPQEPHAVPWWIPVSIVTLLSAAIGLVIYVFVRYRFGKH